ncbi:MAG: hypothetical protein K2L17_11780 [Muribaculaceae bacterium]|nr:hypothetical protein [Muribaculaceae bacterium]
MSKEEVKMMTKSAEQTLAESLRGTPLSSWEEGKRFLAMSDRTIYIFEPTELMSSPAGEDITGRILTFKGVDSYINPDLKEECVIIFSDGSNTFRYRTKKPTSQALKEIESNKIPLLSDLDLIDAWKEQILGRTMWTKSNLWYDSNGNRQSGLKYAKVTIADVLPSTGDFPMNVKITGQNGEEAYIRMNYTSDAHDSRNFASDFFLTDPKGKYQHISDENWKLIQMGKIGPGMTKEECKLSIGNPDEVRSGHNRSQTLDIWQYNDGTYLMFEDGLLTNFRQ